MCCIIASSPHTHTHHENFTSWILKSRKIIAQRKKHRFFINRLPPVDIMWPVGASNSIPYDERNNFLLESPQKYESGIFTLFSIAYCMFFFCMYGKYNRNENLIAKRRKYSIWTLVLLWQRLTNVSREVVLTFHQLSTAARIHFPFGSILFLCVREYKTHYWIHTYQ